MIVKKKGPFVHRCNAYLGPGPSVTAVGKNGGKATGYRTIGQDIEILVIFLPGLCYDQVTGA
jgi:hypothetical protein